MQRSTRTKQAAPKAAAPQAQAPAQAANSNSIAQDLLAEAITRQGVAADESLLLTPEQGEDPMRYVFAEDGDEVAGPEGRHQQDGALPGLRPKHEGTEYMDYTGPAFVKGAGDEKAVDANDPMQGALGNCYLIAGMVAVARANPAAIQELIVDKGDGTFDVTLYIRPSRTRAPKKVVHTIDARLPSKYTGKPIYANVGDRDDKGNGELWPALLEKAVAQETGSYDLISGGNIGKEIPFNGSMELFTGEYESYYRTDGMEEDDALLYLACALEDKKPIICETREMESDAKLAEEANKYNVHGNHAYAPFAADLDSRKVSLTNPWGSSHVIELPIADFLRYYRSIRIAG